ncbi:MAG: OmpA family protein [Pseudonocardiaceae bacterium]
MVAVLTACGSSAAVPEVPTPELESIGAPSAGPCGVPTGSIAIAVSGRANSPAPSLPNQVLRIVGAAVLASPPDGSGPVFTVHRIHGRPDTVWKNSFSSTADPDNKPAVSEDRQIFFDSLFQAVHSVRSEDGEVDVLAALSSSGRAAGPTGTVMLIDSALQTVDPLDFTQPGLLDAATGDVVDFLRANNRLPQLMGRRVILAGIGDTAEPQPVLDDGRRFRVAEIWKEIAEAGGAACVEVIEETRDGAAPTGVPEVDIVPVPAPPSFDPRSQGDLVLDENTVGFVGDLDVLREPETARKVLTPVAEYLKGDPSRRILLTGTTACARTAAFRHELSEKRALAVRRVLVDELGTGSDQIDVRGVGSNFPEYQPDRGPNGQLPGLAVANRTVRLTVLKPGTPAPEAPPAASDRCRTNS